MRTRIGLILYAALVVFVGMKYNATANPVSNLTIEDMAKIDMRNPSGFTIFPEKQIEKIECKITYKKGKK